MEKTKICVCVSVDDGKLNWYSVDLISGSLEESKKRRRTGVSYEAAASKRSLRCSCSLICEIPVDVLPRDGYKFVSLNSQIYMIGGCGQYRSIKSRKPPDCSKHVLVINTIMKESNGLCKLENGSPMIGGKGYPSLHAVDGKIFAIPSFNDGGDAWAEVFDSSSNQWSNLRKPSNEILSLPPNIVIPHDILYEKKRRIFVYYHKPVRLCSFDVETEEWAYDVHDEMTSVLFESPFTSLGRHLIVDDVLYVFHKNDLYAYNLDIQGSTVIKVNGLEDATRTVRSHGYNPAYTIVYLFHLDDNKICMVWSFPTYPESGLRMNFLKFRVKEEEDGSLNAIAIELEHCQIPEATSIVDCLTIKQALDQDTVATPEPPALKANKH